MFRLVPQSTKYKRMEELFFNEPKPAGRIQGIVLTSFYSYVSSKASSEREMVGRIKVPQILSLGSAAACERGSSPGGLEWHEGVTRLKAKT